MSVQGRKEALDRWIRNREISDQLDALRTEKSYLLGVAGGNLPALPGGPAMDAGPSIWERLDRIDDEITELEMRRP